MDYFFYIQYNLFTITITISYILVFISALGLSSTAPEYLKTLDYYLRIYICLFLILRFNPFRKYFPIYKNPYIKFNDLDRKIAFSAGLFILTTSILNNYVDEIKQFINHTFTPN
jgi:cytochrome c biogenesis protein CcdA